MYIIDFLEYNVFQLFELKNLISKILIKIFKYENRVTQHKDNKK